MMKINRKAKKYAESSEVSEMGCGESGRTTEKLEEGAFSFLLLLY